MGRDTPDHYAARARREGFAARSVYKLKEIQTKFHVVRSGDRVLDVGAAPGSWTQYALSILGPAGRIVAVDLKEISGITDARATLLTGDVFAPHAQKEITTHGPFNCIMSDAAPDTTGNRTVDTTRSAALVEEVIGLSRHLLAPGGSLIAKIFQGGEEQRLLRLVRDRFGTAKLFKPESSRKESFEVFMVAKGYTSET